MKIYRVKTKDGYILPWESYSLDHAMKSYENILIANKSKGETAQIIELDIPEKVHDVSYVPEGGKLELIK